MSLTYSINIGQITESSSRTKINDVLSRLPDNFQKLINPKDVRDAILTNWANSVFKIIEQGQFRYIGLDTGDPNNSDIKNKILLGKRRFSGIEVMNSNLLSSDTDIFFYNTKPDNINQNSTKIKILAGNNATDFINSPTLEAKKDSNGKVELNLSALSNINITSDEGYISINKIKFPTLSENQNLINNKVLKYQGQYPNGKLVWSDLDINNTIIGSTNSNTELFGNVTVNSFPLEFIDQRSVSKEIGGIPLGFSFSENSFLNGTQSQNWPISEVLKKLIYPYITPVLELSIINKDTQNKLAEIGTTASLIFSYSVTSYARDSSEFIRDFFIKDDLSVVHSGMSFSSTPGDKLSATFSLSKKSLTDVDYTLYVSNNWDNLVSLTYSNTFGFSYSVTDKIEYIKPFVAKFNNNSFSLSGLDAKNGIKELLLSGNKEISKFPGESKSIMISATGSGFLYLAYPNIYGHAKKIKDPNGFIIHNNDEIDISAFTFSTQQNISPSSPLEYYGNYLIYQTKLPCVYNGLGKFEIIF